MNVFEYYEFLTDAGFMGIEHTKKSSQLFWFEVARELDIKKCKEIKLKSPKKYTGAPDSLPMEMF